ncbi:MAG: thioredoxin family protein [Myxococcota bacterium]
MKPNDVVSRAEWLEARKKLLDAEKALTRVRDEVSAQRRALPWVPVTEAYAFEGPSGPAVLADLFGEYSQLVIYHFMFGPAWDQGCPSCSFWADGIERHVVHLAARDVAVALVSRAPRDKLTAYAARMGWTTPWYSSSKCRFNQDFGVSFDEGDDRAYNFGTSTFGGDEAPGVSIFAKDGEGRVFHTYSTYARGLDMLNTAYHFLDLVPKGRDEQDLPWSMAWLRRRDQYDSVPEAS